MERLDEYYNVNIVFRDDSDVALPDGESFLVKVD